MMSHAGLLVVVLQPMDLSLGLTLLTGQFAKLRPDMGN